MILITKELAQRLPALSETGHQLDPMVQCKFFFPDFHWTWYGIEFDGKDHFYGLVDGDELELGYFSLLELQQNRGKLGMPIERDRYFSPLLLSELLGKLNLRDR